MSVNYDLYRKTFFRETLIVSVKGVVQDITGWTFVMKIKATPTAAAHLLSLTVTAVLLNTGLNLTDAVNGGLTIQINETDTGGLPSVSPPNSGLFYDIVGTHPTEGLIFTQEGVISSLTTVSLEP